MAKIKCFKIFIPEKKMYALEWCLLFIIESSRKTIVRFGMYGQNAIVLTFTSLSSTLIWNARLVWKVAFERYFLDKSKKSKQSH